MTEKSFNKNNTASNFFSLLLIHQQQTIDDPLNPYNIFLGRLQHKHETRKGSTRQVFSVLFRYSFLRLRNFFLFSFHQEEDEEEARNNHFISQTNSLTHPAHTHTFNSNGSYRKLIYDIYLFVWILPYGHSW
jgi:hypothetical protein